MSAMQLMAACTAAACGSVKQRQNLSLPPMVELHSNG
jgi:hypothetical protein